MPENTQPPVASDASHTANIVTLIAALDLFASIEDTSKRPAEDASNAETKPASEEPAD